jgi:RNA ligase
MPQEVLRPYLAAKLISEQSHPDAPYLRVMNYTHRCTYGNAWDEVTMACRGLILDIEKECVMGACFPKFFNYEEHVRQGKAFPNEPPIVTEKYDGWYGSLYWLHDKPWIATRGSFVSPGAQWATRWIRECYDGLPEKTQRQLSNPYVTHLFEIVSAATRIVVQYPFEGLVHLATLSKESGNDISITLGGLRCAGVVQGDDYQTLRGMEGENQEGFVCFWPSTGLRLKVVLAKYRELHALYTRTSAHTIWKQLYDGERGWRATMTMPEELRGWTWRCISALQTGKAAWEGEVEGAYREIMQDVPRTWGKDKTARDRAIGIALNAHPLRGFLLAYHRYQDLLWKAIEPAGSETFRAVDEEDG